MGVKVEMLFTDFNEVRDFFDFLSKNSKSPLQFVPLDPPKAPEIIQTAQPVAQVAQMPAPPADPIKALREAAANLIARLPAGQGPVKVRELLQSQGITKFADATPQQAVTLTALMDGVK